jgi:hypothetical protein
MSFIRAEENMFLRKPRLAGPLLGGVVAGFCALLPAQAAGPVTNDGAVQALLTDLARPELYCKGSAGGVTRTPRLVAMAGEIEALRPLLLADATTGTIDVEDNLDLFEKLGLMEGHLMIGKALLDADMHDDAMPHFGHPVRELYDYLKPVFAVRKSPKFERELSELEQRAKDSPKDAATTAAYNDVIAKVNGLRRTIPDELFKSRSFMIRAIALMMQDAADDLGESIDRGRIANTVEYHDAMGFARYADAVIRANSAVLGDKAGPIAKEVIVTLAAFPSLQPPPRPTRSVANLEAAAERVKALAE